MIVRAPQLGDVGGPYAQAFEGCTNPITASATIYAMRMNGLGQGLFLGLVAGLVGGIALYLHGRRKAGA